MDAGSLKKVYAKGEILENVGAENNLEEIFLTAIGRKK